MSLRALSSSCPHIDLDTLISEYIHLGWHKLKIIFKSSTRIAKEKITSNKTQSAIFLRSIELFTAVRSFLVQYFFDCANRKLGKSQTTFKALGSTTLFSDYDLTLLGKNSPDVMMGMFYLFLRHFGNSLPDAFDTNLYSTGYFSSLGIRKLPEIIIVDSNISTLSPIQDSDKAKCFQFALIKLIEGQVDGVEELKYYSEAKELKHKLDQVLHSKNFNKSQSFKGSYDMTTRQIIRKYRLQYYYAQLLFDILYAGADPERLFEYNCCANYFAIEGYYTPSTINIVVLKSQGKFNVDFPLFDYLCSVVENLGDLNIHYLKYRKEKEFNDFNILLALAKYLLRIYKALYEIIPSVSSYSNLIHDIETKIIPFKGANTTEEFAKIPFSVMNYKGSLKKWIQYHNKEVLDVLKKLCP